jgi:hypothetical protein
VVSEPWRERFIVNANVKGSLGEPWGEIELVADQIIVPDIMLEWNRDGSPMPFLVNDLLYGIAEADRLRKPPGGIDWAKVDSLADVANDASTSADERAKELARHLRKLSAG